jgi:hypothetical protein
MAIVDISLFSDTASPDLLKNYPILDMLVNHNSRRAEKPRDSPPAVTNELELETCSSPVQP